MWDVGLCDKALQWRNKTVRSDINTMTNKQATFMQLSASRFLACPGLRCTPCVKAKVIG